jgi:signal transduction histidine kinase
MDDRKILRVLLNLSKNSVEAMPKGGVLSVSADVTDDGILIKVSDTGVGILEKHLDKIWEPLFTHGKQKGTGFGMAIVKKIVTEHGWDINVTSNKGQGSIFMIHIPANN